MVQTPKLQNFLTFFANSKKKKLWQFISFMMYGRPVIKKLSVLSK